MMYRHLNPALGIKPLDFGADGISFSINQAGRLIALNTYHPQHGYITLCSAPPFAEDERYKPTAVRAYRKSLATLEGFGLEFDSAIVKTEARLLADAIPQIRLTLENGSTAEVTSFIPLASRGGLVQLWYFSDTVPSAYFSGKVWLQRAAYTQLTEGGPVAMPSSKSKIFYPDNSEQIGIENTELGAWALLSAKGAVESEDGSIEFSTKALIYPPAKDYSSTGEPTAIVPGFSIGVNGDSSDKNGSLAHERDAKRLLQESIERWEKRWEKIPDDPILRRGLSYSLSCCVPIDDEASCILTDHMLLPLSWNRDAYYAALALLHWKQADATEQVRRHLIWIFEKAERIDNYFWGRSYLANGKIKDYGFQLDQQLFPLLELADYVRITGDTAFLARMQKYIEPLWQALLMRKAAHSSLFSTDETPADDPIVFPYHFSSHLLFWYVAKRLREIVDKSREGFLEGLQSELKDAIQEHFVAEQGSKRLYSYATNGQGHHHFYHDANDLPLALAPAWGFCSAEDPIWKATIDFAFSPENKGGYYEGRLGSVHTPAAWSLGDVQDLIIARSMGDEGRVQAALRYLQQAAQWDGALPEAYHPKTGEVISRHWFVWPNAAYACTLLGAFDA
jgi:uncharacterized protein